MLKICSCWPQIRKLALENFTIRYGRLDKLKIKKSCEEDENDARGEEMHVCVGSSCCRRSKRFWAIAPPDIRPVETCWSWSFIFKILIISPSLENYHLMMLKWSFHRSIKSWGWKIYSILQDDCIVLYVTQSLILILEIWLLWPWHMKLLNQSKIVEAFVLLSTAG